MLLLLVLLLVLLLQLLLHWGPARAAVGLLLGWRGQGGGPAATGPLLLLPTRQPARQLLAAVLLLLLLRLRLRLLLLLPANAHRDAVLQHASLVGSHCEGRGGGLPDPDHWGGLAG